MFLKLNQPLILAEKLSDCDGGIATYWPDVILAMSIVNCAFAAAGIKEIANVREISPRFIVVVLDAGPRPDVAQGAVKISTYELTRP